MFDRMDALSVCNMYMCMYMLELTFTCHRADGRRGVGDAPWCGVHLVSIGEKREAMNAFLSKAQALARDAATKALDAASIDTLEIDRQHSAHCFFSASRQDILRAAPRKLLVPRPPLPSSSQKKGRSHNRAATNDATDPTDTHTPAGAPPGPSRTMTTHTSTHPLRPPHPPGPTTGSQNRPQPPSVARHPARVDGGRLTSQLLACV